MTELHEVLGRIPYVGLHRLGIEELDGEVRVCIETHPELTNHVGIFHAGALYTAAETAAGVAAWRVIDGDAAFVLLRGATVRYTRRHDGPVTFTARVGTEVAERARTVFAESGRANAALDVRGVDASGELVFDGSYDYALRPRPRGGTP